MAVLCPTSTHHNGPDRRSKPAAEPGEGPHEGGVDADRPRSVRRPQLTGDMALTRSQISQARLVAGRRLVRPAEELADEHGHRRRHHARLSRVHILHQRPDRGAREDAGQGRLLPEPIVCLLQFSDRWTDADIVGRSRSANTKRSSGRRSRRAKRRRFADVT